MQSSDGIRPWLPCRKRVGERSDFFSTGTKSQLGPELAHDRTQNLAIRLEGWLFGTLLEVSVELEDGSVVNMFGMRRKDAVKRWKQSGLPVNKGPIAIECEDLEAAEVEHGQYYFRRPMKET